MKMTYAGFPIEVTYRSNCRRMILRHRQGEQFFRLSLPSTCAQREAEAFLHAHEDWMAGQLSALPQTTLIPAYQAREKHLVLGQRVTLGQNGVPVGQAALTRYRAQELYQLVVSLLPQWTQRMGVQPSRIRWRDMTSQWGSCQTRTKAITLNLRLALYPPTCVEYVLVHELCHLLHPDHSPAFHAEMTRLMPDWQARKQLLKAFDTSPTA